MLSRQLKRWATTVALAAMISGCSRSRPVHYLGEADLKHYRDYSQSVEYANVSQETPVDVVTSHKPRTIKDREQDEIWDVPLIQAVQMAVTNNRMIRTRNNAAQIVENPSQAPSVYDPAIRDSGPLFGNRGVEAALSDFDTQFTTSMIWGRNASVTNNRVGFPPLAGFVNTQETANFDAGLQKTLANGGVVGLSHGWDYLGSNTPGQLFPSSYRGVLSAQYRQPLWAGAGVEYNRIAGPARGGLGGVTGVSQGVAIARINADISVADFENIVVDMVNDVENVYWELYLRYRQFDAAQANRRSALRTWQEVKARRDVGAAGGNLSAEAQARENYFETRARVENAASNIYTSEGALRRLMGLSVNDGRRIRPSDEPLASEFVPHWESCLSEALTHRVELRRQKWQVKSFELQYTAARALVAPRLDFVSNYQMNGFGDKLISEQQADGQTAEGYNSGYGSLLRSSETGWGLGFEMSMPIGFRAAITQVRNVELQLMKARAGLAAQEQEISHQLGEAIRQLDTFYVTARTQLDRLVAAEARVNATEAEYKAQVKDATLDLVLRAQAARAAAESEYHTAVVQYNQQLTELHRQKGTLLENNNISLAEGQWSAAAYQDAYRRAWARSNAFEAPDLETQPSEFAVPYAMPKSDLPYYGTPFLSPNASAVPDEPLPLPEKEDTKSDMRDDYDEKPSEDR